MDRGLPDDLVHLLGDRGGGRGWCDLRVGVGEGQRGEVLEGGGEAVGTVFKRFEGCLEDAEGVGGERVDASGEVVGGGAEGAGGGFLEYGGFGAAGGGGFEAEVF